MLKQFTEELKVLYNEVKKGQMIDFQSFKVKWKIEGSIGEAYQKICSREYKKEKGSFYTPPEIVKFMVEKALRQVDFICDPMVKVLDPCCGGGAFLTELCSQLSKKAEASGIGFGAFHVLSNNLYGFDTDMTAVMISSLELYERFGIFPSHIVCADFLTEQEDKFDIIIGNPPYMGHKLLTGEYREKLQSLYPQVFFDKGDMAYCFIKKSIDSLRSFGKLSLLTSRYLLEAFNANGIRKYMLQHGNLREIIDFYGIRPVKGAGVDTMIFEFTKDKPGTPISYYRLKGSVKAIGSGILDDSKLQDKTYADYVAVAPGELKKEGWVFTSPEEMSILNKITGRELRYFCESHQGIITGCDKAFVLEKNKAQDLGIDIRLLKPWIKSTDINQFSVDEGKNVLIYSPLININSDKAALSYISAYKEKLEKRRECLNGRRKWYELQWGRESFIFEEKKLVYPYKSPNNRFAIDQGSYFSADVYAIRLSDMFQGAYTYEYLSGILNSSIYEFYFKTMAKKLGENMYEYYPNKLMTLRVPDYMEDIDSLVRQDGENLRESIDSMLCQRFGITKEEYEIIRSWCR